MDTEKWMLNIKVKFLSRCKMSNYQQAKMLCQSNGQGYICSVIPDQQTYFGSSSCGTNMAQQISSPNALSMIASTPNRNSCIFFTLIPPAIYDRVYPGEGINFFTQGPCANGIQPDLTYFMIPTSGTYVMIPISGTYSVTVLLQLSSPGTVVVKLNGTELPQTAMSTDQYNQIFGTVTITINGSSNLAIINPTSSTTPLNILQGGSYQTLLLLIITRLC